MTLLIQCFSLLLAQSSGMHSGRPWQGFSLTSFKPQVLPQDCLHLHPIGARTLRSYNPNRHPSCRLSVRSVPAALIDQLNFARENLKYERKITLPIPVRSSTFGVPLEDLMGFNGEKGGIPRVVKDCIQYIRETGVDLPFYRLYSMSLIGLLQVCQRKVYSGGRLRLRCFERHRTLTIGVSFSVTRAVPCSPRSR
jgi:hypothetical protein